LKLDLINSAESSTALFSLCYQFLVINALATVSYNVPGIRGVPGVYRPGAKLAIIPVIVQVLTLCQRACR